MKTKQRKSPLDLYQNVPGGHYFWRLRATNGRIVADGAEGYTTRAKALAGFRAAVRLARTVIPEGRRNAKA